MMRSVLIFGVLAVSFVSCEGEEAYLASYQGWDYYKVRASGTMTSANIKITCEAAGYVMPCPQEPTCQYTPSTCTDTGLVGIRCGGHLMDEISQVLSGQNPIYCPAMEGIFTCFHSSSYAGDAIGVQPITSPGNWFEGADYSNQFAFCAKVLNADKCFQLSEEPKAHQAAEGQCVTLGGTLAGVKTVAEQEFLADQVRLGTDVSHWVGLKNGQEHFLYTDLSTMSSNLRWMSGKPEHLCALLDKNGNYDLNADFCTEQYNYVCESDVVTCKQNVCLNGGNCTSCFNETYAYCDCAPGFVGNRCEISYGRADADLYRCESFSCPYGWSCQDRGQLSFMCGAHV
ncbi:PREDICTED: protein lin-12-like [Branchiostoma belcheri]|uniref:Protein lin-12-like n=1 Tax=Branchiostoma belcheri TaxID=7741 RepID=A0A6P5A159_BRABE|nr:PREDICTED: protein lin-12-like [Branchiostoma belcheri]